MQPTVPSAVTPPAPRPASSAAPESAARGVRGYAPEIVLAALFVALNAALLMGGIRSGGDTGRYLEGAARLLAGEGLQGRQATFAGYAAVVALSRGLGLGLAGVVALQLALAALAAVALYDLGTRLGGRAAGWLAAAFYALNPDFARWHAVILTESLYTSLVILAAWTVLRAAERGGGAYALAVATVAFAALVRPNGWLLPPVAIAWWIARAPWPRRRRAALLGALAAAGVAALLALSQGAVRDVRTYEELREGTVVWGDDARRMTMPTAGTPATGGPAQMVAYALRHPVATLRLVTERMGVELAHTRPFYSAAHNAAVVLVLMPLYAFAVLGLARVSRRVDALLLLAVTATQLALIGATFADWDGRFLLYFLPLIGVFAAVGAAPVIDRIASPKPLDP